MQAHDSTSPCSRQEKLHIRAVILKEVFCEDGSAERILQNVEVTLNIAIPISRIHPERTLRGGIASVLFAS